MSVCKLDPSLERIVVGNFQFPLGVYPIEPMTPRPGYTLLFESADGGEDQEWEEWPDRYLFDAVVSFERLESLVWTLFSLFPGRVYPILDILGHDDYREIDPFVSYDLIGVDRMMDHLRRYREFFFEDGMCGFGAMTEEPFLYVFVDEHKIVTVRAQTDLKDRIERIMRAYDLEPVEEPAGADSAAHEHRGVLLAPEDDKTLLPFDEIAGRLRDEWRLILNIDPESNVDDEGAELGVTPWRCVVRIDDEPERDPRFAEIFLAADGLRSAEDTALHATEELLADSLPLPEEEDVEVIIFDRVTPDHLREFIGAKGKLPKKGPWTSGTILAARWIEPR
ncbi:MAG: hypothetical protein KF787_04760 [Phycisphaeraceae bacterium]|nr:hypothetical protein [Phycisphaerae bacterium]MBX3391940.1 hypothetical protein [Phycisphaeraceae bacterium]HRJ49435.1 hypothetical protein [Phycisphaerales bacterium]